MAETQAEREARLHAELQRKLLAKEANRLDGDKKGGKK